MSSSFGRALVEFRATIVGPLSIVPAPMEFILPPSLDTALDISNALNYTIGEKITVYWTEAPASTAVSIILWQADPKTGVSIKNVEYILRIASTFKS